MRNMGNAKKVSPKGPHGLNSHDYNGVKGKDEQGAGRNMEQPPVNSTASDWPELTAIPGLLPRMKQCTVVT